MVVYHRASGITFYIWLQCLPSTPMDLWNTWKHSALAEVIVCAISAGSESMEQGRKVLDFFSLGEEAWSAMRACQAASWYILFSSSSLFSLFSFSTLGFSSVRMLAHGSEDPNANILARLESLEDEVQASSGDSWEVQSMSGGNEFLERRAECY